MSGIDVREIKLKLRYPDSRQEDVTDAFTRGYTGAIEVSNRAIEKLQAENERLRELVRDMYKAFMHGNCYRWCEFKEPCNYISDGRCQWYDRMRELGVDE